MDDLEPSDVAKALGSIPLFREIQRLLMASATGVNWQIAETIAHELAEAKPGIPADESDRNQLIEDYRIAEMRVSSATGLGPSGVVTKVIAVDRKTWAASAIANLRPDLDRLAARLSGQVDLGSLPIGLGGLVSGLAPIAFGIQFGMMFGALSRRILSRHDLELMDFGGGDVLVVFPNVVETERDFELEPMQFRMWLMLNEAARQLLLDAVPWLSQRQRELLTEYIDAAQLDPEAIASKFTGAGDPEDMLGLLERPDQLIPLLQNETQRQIGQQLTTLMTVVASYIDHVITETGHPLLQDFGRIAESAARRRAAPSSAERLYEALLGLDLKGERYRAGSRFMATIVPAGGVDKLWSRPENLPSADELEDPARWLDRVLFS